LKVGILLYQQLSDYLRFNLLNKQLGRISVFAFMFQRQSFRVAPLLGISSKEQYGGIQLVCQGFSSQF